MQGAMLLPLLLALVAVPVAAQQNEGRGTGAEAAAAQAQAPPAESKAIRLLSPRHGEVLRDPFVTVEWELIDPGPAWRAHLRAATR